MKPLISIIIPCYNSELYIRESIESIANQIDNNAEIIIINDGSTDNSEKIIFDCISKYPNTLIKYYKQANSGAGHTRNQGIIFSQGIYIGFLDSDDIWLDNTWKILKPILLNEKNDIIEFDAYRFDKKININNQRIFESYFNQSKNLTQDKKIEKLFTESKWAPWSRIYHKKIIKNTYFLTPCRLGEDIPFTSMAYLNSKNILSLNLPLIGYRFNTNSITNTPKKSDQLDRKNIIKKLLELSNEKKEKKEKYLIHVICLRIWTELRFYNFKHKEKETSIFLKETKKTLNQYNYKNIFSKKFIIFYKFNIIAWLVFFIKTRKK